LITFEGAPVDIRGAVLCWLKGFLLLDPEGVNVSKTSDQSSASDVWARAESTGTNTLT